MNKIFLLAILPFLVVIPADADHGSNDYHFECYDFLRAMNSETVDCNCN